jgi:hypothetical protein
MDLDQKKRNGRPWATDVVFKQAMETTLMLNVRVEIFVYKEHSCYPCRDSDSLRFCGDVNE